MTHQFYDLISPHVSLMLVSNDLGVYYFTANGVGSVIVDCLYTFPRKEFKNLVVLVFPVICSLVFHHGKKV